MLEQNFNRTGLTAGSLSGEMKDMNEEGRKRVLLLGAGIGQLFLAKKIKQEGH